MQFPVLEPTIDLRSETRSGTEAVAQMVQELLRVAAASDHRDDVAYFPETFLTRW